MFLLSNIFISTCRHLAARNVDLLVGATLTLYYGRRYGLVGRNGVGKSTLMDRMARKLIKGMPVTWRSNRPIHTHGLWVDFPAHLRVLLVKQEINGDERSVLDTVVDSDEERTALIKEESTLQRDPIANADRIAEVCNIHTRSICLTQLSSHTV